MIDRMQNQALMVRILGKIRLPEYGVRDRQAGLPIASAIIPVADGNEVVAEADTPLSGDAGGGTVNGLPRIERIGRSGQVIAEPMEIRRAGVPHRNSVRTAVFE